jgi:hypothetical protein
MWLCNLFTILMCLAAVDNCDAVQQTRYGAILNPPQHSSYDENNAAITQVTPEEIPVEASTWDADRR